jgi:hypothetical protein
MADRWRTGSLALALAALLLTGCSSPTPASTPVPGGNADQACAAPQATASASASIVAHGESITIEGTDWEECNDTPNDTTPSPRSHLSLEWIQGVETTHLGEATAVNGAFQFVATVPSDATPGQATIRVTAAELSAEVPVTVKEK